MFLIPSIPYSSPRTSTTLHTAHTSSHLAQAPLLAIPPALIEVIVLTILACVGVGTVAALPSRELAVLDALGKILFGARSFIAKLLALLLGCVFLTAALSGETMSASVYGSHVSHVLLGIRRP